MYILVEEQKLREIGNENVYEKLPDGRCIVPMSDVKMMKSLMGVDMIQTEREVIAIIDEQKKLITPSLHPNNEVVENSDALPNEAPVVDEFPKTQTVKIKNTATQEQEKAPTDSAQADNKVDNQVKEQGGKL